ncbi:MAG: BMP family ABC transporter substrate-binding protein, partial [Chlamydiia bacterium]|nr:BMP family ABC transporter substrate-binding protein [Chlamydiia bacterium]
MKINKKFLLGLSSSILVVAPIATVVSCGVDYGKNYRYYGDIQVITDAGSVKDKSFNQSAFEAAENYTYLPGIHKTFGFSQPKNSTTTLLQKAYLSALKAGSRTLILPGFTHSSTSNGDAISFAKRMHSRYPKARFISPDGFSPDEKAANKVGFYNLSYASQESGFLAAVYGGIFFNAVKHVTEPIKAATFGGLALPYAVTSYMDGYLQGINYFNTHKGTLPQPIKPIFYKGNRASKKDFTYSFDAGQGTAISQKYINNGAQMILPVAGPQTGDVIGVIASNSKRGKVYAIGVDVDQSKVYNPDYLMGSAIKGVYISTAYAIKKLKDRTSTPIKLFSKFDLKLVNDSDFKSFQTSMKKTLVSHGKTSIEAENIIKPTGFVPSTALSG